jgi:hypothetical protein
VIPPFDPVSKNLPAGIYEATWDEILARFGFTAHRLTLLAGIKEALDALHAAGCRRAYLDGSFVTAKEIPGDFDVCWETAGIDWALLASASPVLLTFDPGRAAQKAKYGGELFPADAAADLASRRRYLEFFQRDKRTGDPKGIVAMDLGDLP